MAKIKKQRNSPYHKHRPRGVARKDFARVHWPYLPLWLIVCSSTVAVGGLELGVGGAIAGGALMAVATLALAL